MTCRIVTQGRKSGFRLPSHPCTHPAIRDGLCKVHLKQRDTLPRQIERAERKVADLRALLDTMSEPAAPENPS